MLASDPAEPDDAHAVLPFAHRCSTLRAAKNSRRVCGPRGDPRSMLPRSPGGFAVPFVQAGSVRLEYHQTGSGDRVVVLVHGLTASHRAWHVVQDQLGDLGFRTIAIANRGAAGSDRTPEVEDYTPSQGARDLAAVMESLGVPRAALVGASLGARTVTRVVQWILEKVACLALVAGGSLDARRPLTEEARAALEQRAATWPAATSREALAAHIQRSLRMCARL
ncbi:MAG: alpha/beta hydrolase, partial [Chloroflexi bacterium]|nr:alpha/beta hydrolase [Chloroflexota bacterium]